jgi:formylglycine-generating enzyme
MGGPVLRGVAAALCVAFALTGVVAACHDLNAFGPTEPGEDASRQSDAPARTDVRSDVVDAGAKDVVLEAGPVCPMGQVYVEYDCNAADPMSCCKSAQSCAKLALTCGPDASGYCCATSEVAGVGEFSMGYDVAGDPDDDIPGFQQSAGERIIVSTYWLDEYEVTVGRFRKFLNAYDAWIVSSPREGCGANPNISATEYDGGTAWQNNWSEIPDDVGPSRDYIEQQIENHCDSLVDGGAVGTWTPDAGANESLPMTCINWYESYMFCIWDGGRLPTEAEWEYAAAHGGGQYAYPWTMSTDPSVSPEYAVYELTGPSPVGDKPLGRGGYGQYDLAGNVYEWVMDSPTGLKEYGYELGKTDPIDLSGGGSNRVIRGGSFAWPPVNMRTSYRYVQGPTARWGDVGVRCARPATCISCSP